MLRNPMVILRFSNGGRDPDAIRAGPDANRFLIRIARAAALSWDLPGSVILRIALMVRPFSLKSGRAY
jgi:hypothetical protein